MMKKRNSKIRITIDDSLHGDLLTQILIKLPVKSLLRLKCVSKQWRSLIETPEFISLHVSTYRDNVEENFLLDHSTDVKCQVYERKTLKKTGLRFLNPIKSFVSGFRDHLDGVLLLAEEETRQVVMWNPSIRKHVSVVSADGVVERFGDTSFQRMMFAIGCDCLRCDYKVVVIVYYCDEYYVDDDDDGGVESDDLGDRVDENWNDCIVVDDWKNNNHSTGELPDVVPNTVLVSVGVYSLNSNSWKTIAHQTRLIRLGPHSEKVFLNGSMNWIGNHFRKSEKGKLKERIMSFDVGSEVFSYFMVPEDKKGSNRSFGALGEFLAILDHIRFPMEHCCLWVMEKFSVSSSWTQRYTIGVEDINPFFVMRFNKLGDIMFAHKDGGIRSYNVIDGQTIDYGNGQNFSIVCMSSYMESLALSTVGKELLVNDKREGKAFINLAVVSLAVAVVSAICYAWL